MTSTQFHTSNTFNKAFRGLIFHISYFHILYLAFLFPFLVSCSTRPTSLPTTYTEVSDSVRIYPDYCDVTIPPNIAPMNFMVVDTLADAFVADIEGVVCGAGKDGKMDIDSTAWRCLLAEHRGKALRVSLYAHREQGWVKHPSFAFHVAEEEIDPYVTYRLIEPGYEVYQQLGIYQRNLTNFNVITLYENNRDIDHSESHCINCHNFQNNDTQRMYLHVRENHKGTVFTHGTEIHKVLIKHDSILTSGAYGKWHPTLPLVAYSTNRTAQFFHMRYSEKIEVYDNGSDLLLYDADRNEVRNIFLTNNVFETFPCWSADGTRLYYVAAQAPKAYDAANEFELVIRYDSLRYNLYSMPFDTVTYTFGEPRVEVDAAAENLSCTVPRVSPDGRYLLYSLATYGQFHLYHRNADLWVKDLTKKYESNLPSANSYPLTASNSSDSESYNCWSSNSRWIVFSTRRDDGDFTRTYIAYFDAQGQGHRAFLLPQHDPEYNLLLLKSYNVAELTRNPVPVTESQMNHAIVHTEAELAAYKGMVDITSEKTAVDDKK